MTDRLEVGDAILFMKVGMHAQESLEKILLRKQAEIDRAGFAMWGYGGPTCQPTRVRPFAQERREAGEVIRLVMEPVNSHHDRSPDRATEYSLDRDIWHAIPDEISVLGSKFALFIENLRETSVQLPLGATAVALGDRLGKAGSDYIRGRVDKACLEVTDAPGEGRVVTIALQADIVDPYAAFVR